MTTEVMKGIWNYGTNYTKFVLYGNWMDAKYLLPAIGYMYKILQLVMYDNRQMMDGSRQFTTYLYTDDRNISSVSCEIRPGLIHHINPSGNACIIYIKEQQMPMLHDPRGDCRTCAIMPSGGPSRGVHAVVIGFGMVAKQGRH